MQFSFASDNFIQKANAFIQAVVSRYYTLYPQSILYVTATTTLSSEVGYPAATVADYSAIANAKFSSWLQAKYGSIASLNLAWGTSFPDFNSAPPPADSPAMWKDVHGLDWSIFRHDMMKQALESFGATIHGVSPNLRYGIQFAGISDSTSNGRGIVNFPDLIEGADVVWNDDAWSENHNYTMDLLRTNSPGRWIAAEFGGLTESPNALTVYPPQATQSFNHGATILSISNWTQADLANNRPFWSQIASLLSQPVTTRPVSSSMTESAYNIVINWGSASYQPQYQTLSNNGANWVSVVRHNDLEPCFPHANALEPSDVLRPGECLLSNNRTRMLLMQDDNNLVLYRFPTGGPMWASNTLNIGGNNSAAMQGDGNFCVYPNWPAGGPARWCSMTHRPGAYLYLQDDGNLVIYAQGGQPLWATGTNHP